MISNDLTSAPVKSFRLRFSDTPGEGERLSLTQRPRSGSCSCLVPAFYAKHCVLTAILQHWTEGRFLLSVGIVFKNEPVNGLVELRRIRELGVKECLHLVNHRLGQIQGKGVLLMAPFSPAYPQANSAANMWL